MPAAPRQIEALGRPLATYARGFTNVVGVRELRDGRVIVLDSHERLIVLFESDGREIRTIGRTGSGPGEFSMPSAIFAASGDSTLIRDEANGRFLVITPTATAGDIVDIYGRPPGAKPLPNTTPSIQAADTMGRFWARAQATHRSADGEYALQDSAAIERWRAGLEQRDTVAFIPVRHVPGTMTRGGIVAYLAKDRPAYWTTPEWAVGPSGVLAIAHDRPYHVEVIDAAGHRHVGPPIPHETVKVTEAMKAHWCDGKDRPAPMLVGRRGSPPTVQLVRRPCEPPQIWPDVLPPFVGSAVHVAPNEVIWIERVSDNASSKLFDLVDRSGTWIRSIELPSAYRWVGFGRSSVYVVWRDEVDLEHLERYALPDATQ